MGNEKVLISMESKLNMYDKLGIIPIFDKLESEDEFEFLKENTPNNTLFSGNYFSNEKKLILKNRWNNLFIRKTTTSILNEKK